MAIGPTGSFPRGKLNKDDEGEAIIAIATRDATVMIAFGKPVAWLGLDADRAIRFATTILKHAARLKGEPIAVAVDAEGGIRHEQQS